MPVAVSAGRSLRLLVPSVSDLEPRIRAAPGLTLPIEEGQRVGTVAVHGPDGTLYGRVPAISVADVRRPPPPELPWWTATIDRMRSFLRDLFEALL
jgi:hypothetical protein